MSVDENLNTAQVETLENKKYCDPKTVLLE